MYVHVHKFLKCLSMGSYLQQCLPVCSVYSIFVVINIYYTHIYYTQCV